MTAAAHTAHARESGEERERDLDYAEPISGLRPQLVAKEQYPDGFDTLRDPVQAHQFESPSFEVADSDLIDLGSGELEVGGISRPRPMLVSTSGVRVEVVHELHGVAQPAARPFVEVRTRNTAYGFDAHLDCVYVHDLRTNTPLAAHPMIGARLLGGVKRCGKECREATPIPSSGMLAILRRRSDSGFAYAKTSWVTDVCVFVYVRSRDEGNTTLAHVDQDLVNSTAPVFRRL